MAANLVPAAQYLRMSTENQQYSLQNQADAIAKYAIEHGFDVVKTYSDAAKSGLRLQNRAGLKQLLKDVVEGQVMFRAVLVYDVSRWGRFQDGHVRLEIRDSGKGIPLEKQMALTSSGQLGVGVRGMRERIGQLGGVLVVQSDTTGTTITATLPIAKTTMLSAQEVA